MSLSRLRREAKKAYSDPALISHGDVRYPYRCLVGYTAFSVCLAALLALAGFGSALDLLYL